MILSFEFDDIFYCHRLHRFTQILLSKCWNAEVCDLAPLKLREGERNGW